MYLNDLQVSISHLERLIKDIISSELINNNFMASEKQAVEDEIRSLQDFGPKIKANLKVRYCFLLQLYLSHWAHSLERINFLIN